MIQAIPQFGYTPPRTLQAVPTDESSLRREQNPGFDAFSSGSRAHIADNAPSSGRSGLFKTLGRKAIEWYQNNRFIHEKLYKWIGLHCVYSDVEHYSPDNPNAWQRYDSCSEFTKKAIEKHGFFKGCILGFKRIMNCNGKTLHQFMHGDEEQVKFRVP